MSVAVKLPLGREIPAWHVMARGDDGVAGDEDDVNVNACRQKPQKQKNKQG